MKRFCVVLMAAVMLFAMTACSGNETAELQEDSAACSIDKPADIL